MRRRQIQAGDFSPESDRQLLLEAGAVSPEARCLPGLASERGLLKGLAAFVEFFVLFLVSPPPGGPGGRSGRTFFVEAREFCAASGSAPDPGDNVRCFCFLALRLLRGCSDQRLPLKTGTGLETCGAGPRGPR